MSTVWVALSIDERTVIAVADTPEQAKAACAADIQAELAWRPHRRSGFVCDEWDYEVRPFEVIS